MTSHEDLGQELDNAIERQNRWRRIMSFGYFTSTGAAIFGSAAATVAAGLDYADWAAVLAGLTTVLYGLEKGLLLREKWAHHLRTSAQLEALRLNYVYGGLDTIKVSKVMGEIGNEYALNLPISSRDDLSPTDS